jgi:hypothetical protein
MAQAGAPGSPGPQGPPGNAGPAGPQGLTGGAIRFIPVGGLSLRVTPTGNICTIAISPTTRL